MATKSKSRSGGSKSLSEQKDPAKDVTPRSPGRSDVAHPAGADVEINKSRAQEREDQAAERRADRRQVSNPSLLQSARDEALEHVRDVNARQREEWHYHGRTEIEREIKGVESEPGKDDGGSVFVSTAGGRLYVSCSAKEVVLDHDGAADLMRYAQTAFQAVS